MPNYIRDYSPGSAYFFTVVACRRRHLFEEPLARKCLRSAIRKTKAAQHFDLVAMCLLPDHMHRIWLLPEDDSDFSSRWARLKGAFSREFLKQGGEDGMQTVSRLRKGEASLFQRRFWEHRIVDERDMNCHFDYIHFNPVKHRLVACPEDWPWSTFHKYLRMGWYDKRQLSSDITIGLEAERFGE